MACTVLEVHSDTRYSYGSAAAPPILSSCLMRPFVINVKHLHLLLPARQTRSGKIMRRILRKIAANKLNEIGDTSTLADPGIVEQLLANHGK